MFVAGPDSKGTLNVAAMDALSSELGLDVARLTALRLEKNDEYQALLDADRNEGQSFGINGTPGTIVGTTLLSGAQPFSALKPLIDAELAK
jgi:protein-disulfide isomerase